MSREKINICCSGVKNRRIKVATNPDRFKIMWSLFTWYFRRFGWRDFTPLEVFGTRRQKNMQISKICATGLKLGICLIFFVIFR